MAVCVSRGVPRAVGLRWSGSRALPDYLTNIQTYFYYAKYIDKLFTLVCQLFFT
jgi:hypothetical protein